MCSSKKDDHGRQKSCLLSLSCIEGHSAQTSGKHSTVEGTEQGVGCPAEILQDGIFRNLTENVQLKRSTAG